MKKKICPRCGGDLSGRSFAYLSCPRVYGIRCNPPKEPGANRAKAHGESVKKQKKDSAMAVVRALAKSPLFPREAQRLKQRASALVRAERKRKEGKS